MWGLASSAISRGLSALRFPALDLSDPERVICGAATLTDTNASNGGTLQSRRLALIDRLAKMHPNDARRTEVHRQLSDLTIEALRRGQ